MRQSVSFSELKGFRDGCKHRWNLDYLQNFRYDPRFKIFGIYLDFGTCIHGAIELYKTRKDPITLEAAQEKFEADFRKMFTENHEKYKGREATIPVDDFVSAGRRILEHLSGCDELWKAEVVYNEHELKLPIDRTDDLQIQFKGYIDMVIKTVDKRGKPILYVIDFKTCSWGWTQEKKQDQTLHAQLMLYKHFLCKKWNLEPTQVRTAFVLLKRSPRKGDIAVDFFPISAGPVSVQRALDNMNADITLMKETIEQNKLVPDFTKCVDSYGGVCPYAGNELCPGSKKP